MCLTQNSFNGHMSKYKKLKQLRAVVQEGVQRGSASICGPDKSICISCNTQQHGWKNKA